MFLYNARKSNEQQHGLSKVGTQVTSEKKKRLQKPQHFLIIPFGIALTRPVDVSAKQFLSYSSSCSRLIK